jgi:hypothetical protein
MPSRTCVCGKATCECREPYSREPVLEPCLHAALAFARDAIVLATIIPTPEAQSIARMAMRTLKHTIALEKRGLEFGLIDLGGEGG